MRTDDKLRTDPPISALDFGVPDEFAERAESYARWAVAKEREACAQIIEKQDVDPAFKHRMACGIRGRS